MAEKRVNVRFGAQGGKQVKTELQGIGNAGERGFRKVSREAEIANAKLARFGRRAKVAFGLMAAAAVAAGVTMVRTGLQGIDRQAKMAASLNTTVKSMQVLARAGELAGVSIGEMEQATLQLTRRLSMAAAGTGPAVKALERLNLTAAELAGLPVDEKIAALQDALAKFVPEAEQAAVAAQIFGDRAGLVFTRIDSATLRQATKDVQDFGVAVSQEDAAQIERTNDALSRLGLLWRGLANQLAVAVAPSLEAVADAMAAFTKTTGPLGRAIKVLLGSLKEIALTAVAFATFLAGRWLYSVGAAVIGVGKLSLSLVALRTALLRTGIGVLVVGFAALVMNGPKLAKVIRDIVQPQSEFQVATTNLVLAMGDQIKQAQLLEVVLQRGAAMSFAMAETKLEEAKARYKNVAAIIAEHKASAFASEDYENLLTRIKQQHTLINTLGFPAIDAAPVRYRATFEVAQQDLVALLNLQQEMLREPEEMQEQLERVQKNIATLGAALANAKDGVVTFGGALIEPITLSETLATAVAGAGKAAGSAAVVAKTAWEMAEGSLKDYAIRAMDLGKGLGDSFVKAFQSAENAVAQFVKTGKLDFNSLVTSLLADMAKLATRKFILGPLANWLGGAFGAIGASVKHSGGMVGVGGPQRMVPARAFADAPRLHNGGWAGLRPNEVPAILERGERVLSRREVAAGAGAGGIVPVNITIMTRDAESFRQSRAQVAADLSRAVALGRRGM